MADLKHRMLYQGQDPSQPVLRPSRQDAPIADPQYPPAYDDAIIQNATTLHQSNPQSHSADRRTFFAEPQHLSSQLLDERPERHQLAEQPTQQLPIDGQYSSLPQVRSK
ncbi:GH12149 [Drosophila grimshawi]|uniref:GH12149 n=1 Tax=Drosophila grimshawi TaxID=7222 RepID=B4JJZ0_DROGR|nr:GH12149 [Drosophila grimshawi]